MEMSSWQTMQGSGGKVPHRCRQGRWPWLDSRVETLLPTMSGMADQVDIDQKLQNAAVASD